MLLDVMLQLLLNRGTEFESRFNFPQDVNIAFGDPEGIIGAVG